MPQDNSCQNLRGRNFKGQDLAGANFSYADIRGANFSGANLTGANFTHAKAGLQRRWATLLVLISWLFSGLSGFLWSFNGFVVSLIFDDSTPNQISGWVTLIVLIVFFFVIIRQGIAAALGAFAFAVAVAVAFAVGFAFAVAFAFAVGFAFAFAFAFAVAFAVGFAVAGAFAVSFAGAVAVGFAGAFAFVVAVAFAVARAFPGAVAFAVAVAVAVAGILLSIYITWRAMKGDEKYFLIRNFAIAFAATGGTSFCGADLTNADFTQATLKSTDFRKAILTTTHWHQVKMLDRVRPGSTYLQNEKVRQLLVTGQGQDKNFNRENLRGINLQKANLADASFIGADLSEANLQDADLSRAKLKQTQLDGTDLTGATLTGAFIEDWGITNTSKLHGTRCEYIFMRLPTKENPNPLRKPDNNKEVFADGDFAEFIKPIFDTLDLYHNQGVDPRAIAISFKQLAENHPEAELEIVAIEKRAEDKVLLRAKTAPEADKSQLSAEYFDLYNQYKALRKADLIYLLAQKDGQVQSLEIAFRAVTRGLKEVAETPKKQSNFNLQGAQFAGGLVDAETVTANQIGGNITNYTPEQKQNLAQAAADIQQLLHQLEQTYPTNTPLEKQIVVTEALKEIERNPTLKARVIGALKAGGTEALKELLDHPVVNVLLAALEGWQEVE